MQTVFLALNVEYEGYKQEEKIFKRLESPYYVDQSYHRTIFISIRQVIFEAIFPKTDFPPGIAE